MNACEFFITQSIQHARSLPLPDAIAYLRGLLELAGDNPDVAQIRALFVHLSESTPSHPDWPAETEPLTPHAQSQT